MDDIFGPVAEQSLAMKTLAKSAMIAAVVIAGYEISNAQNPGEEAVKQGIILSGSALMSGMIATSLTAWGASALTVLVPSLVIGGLVGLGLNALYDPFIKPFLEDHGLDDISGLVDAASDYIDDLWDLTGEAGLNALDGIADAVSDLSETIEQLTRDYAWALDNPGDLLPDWLQWVKDFWDPRKGANNADGSPLVLDLGETGIWRSPGSPYCYEPG